MRIKKFLHDKMEWIFDVELKDVDPRGFQNNYTCCICGKEVLPSSGGYFHSGLDDIKRDKVSSSKKPDLDISIPFTKYRIKFWV